jgi:hypothetical protein
LKTRTSAFAGAGFADDVAELVVPAVLVAIDDDWSPSESPEPIAWNPTSRNTTPRNSNTITMARKGSPEEFRWFITAHCIERALSAGKP